MQKRVLTLSLFTITSLNFAQQKAQSDQVLIDAIRARHKNASTDYESLNSCILKLIDEKEFGDELAEFLDLQMRLQNYQYRGKGIYEFHTGRRMHHFHRHLCEDGVTQEEITDAQRPFMSEVLTLGIPDATNNPIVVTVDKEVPLGSKLY